MALIKREYKDQETVITAENLNEIQDAIIALEDGLFSIDNDKNGEIITITDAAKRGFRSLNVYGKTAQNGTPTPDAPVNLVSVGDSGSIGVTVSGKNVFQFSEEVRVENGSIVESTTIGGTFQGNPGDNPGSTAWTSGWAHFDRAYDLYLKAGTVITISADYTVLEKHSSAKDWISILFGSHSGRSNLDIRNAEVGVKYRISRTLTIPEDGKYKRTTFTTHSSKVKIENVQWELGEVASDFVPYKGQMLAISTPNGLPGIPVASGGNYTDANGQQWICDEIDFARGVYVQRVKTIVFNGKETWLAATSNFKNCVAFNHTTVGKHTANGAWTQVISNIAPIMTAAEYANADINGVGGYGASITYKILKTVLASDAETNADALDEWKSYLVTKAMSERPVTAQYILATPIETPLSEEELAAYAALHTYRNNTTVSNDAGAWMDLEYAMDAKKYIDSLALGTIAPATVE